MDFLYKLLRQRFPVNWRVESTLSEIIIHDELLVKGTGYSIRISETYHGIKAIIEFEVFSGDISQHAETKLQGDIHYIKYLFISNPDFILRRYRRTVEDIFKEGTDDDGWWLELELKNRSEKLIQNFSDILLSLAVYLFPYKIDGMEEGAKEKTTIEIAERNTLNRAICLAFHGYSCKACGLNLNQRYGDAALQLIEVHHLEQLSERGIANTDPIRDLVPLCPNCHGIAHKKSPPFTIKEIVLMLDKNSTRV